VLKPREDSVVPSDNDFSLVVQGRRVIVLVDDLTRYVGSKTNLVTFSERLSAHASWWVVVSTCRDGPELETVREAAESGVANFYEAIPEKFRLLPLSTDDKGVLSRSVDQAWDPEDSDEYPSPGFIVMQKDIRAMRNRFQDLDASQPELRDALRALKLLTSAGVVPLTRGRLRSVLAHIFDRVDIHLGDCLDRLASRSFLRLDSRETIVPEPAYLRYVVTYTPKKVPKDDFEALAEVFERLKDAEGLSSLGLTYGRELGEHQRAVDLLDRALRFDPRNARTLVNKGVSLAYLGRYEAALRTQEEALRLAPSFTEGLYNKGLMLKKFGRREEALAAYEEALRQDPDFVLALHGKGGVLHELGRDDEALPVIEEALRLRPEEPTEWYTLSIVLDRLGQLEASLNACEEALRLKSDYREAWDGKGLALGKLGQYENALYAFEEALRLDPDYSSAWNNKGMAHLLSGEPEQALVCFDRVIHLDREDPSGWGGKGISLAALGRRDEAIRCMCRAWSTREQAPGSEAEMMVTFQQLGYDPRMCDQNYPPGEYED
jgi:tetratricopeptide (TPR) repeat protein